MRRKRDYREDVAGLSWICWDWVGWIELLIIGTLARIEGLGCWSRDIEDVKTIKMNKFSDLLSLPTNLVM